MYNYNSKYTIYFRDILTYNPVFTQNCIPDIPLGALITKDYLANSFNSRFMNRQIGYETVQQFKIALDGAFFAHVPALAVKIKGLEYMLKRDVGEEYTETETISRADNGSIATSGKDSSNSKNTSSSNTNTNTVTETRFSDTPQNSISNLDNYITSAERSNNAVTGTQEDNSSTSGELTRESNTNSNMDSNTTRKVSGTHGSYYAEFYRAAEEIIAEFLSKFNVYFLSLFG